uniref:Zinc finger family protein n=1 Tax=Rhizophora mucronata TaxID=61149 RepID=A0A2P2Q4J7_RHIMU
MPSFDDPDHHHQQQQQQQHGRGSLPKPNQKFLSLILKATIMTFITTLFFLFLGVTAILLILSIAALHNRHSATFSSPKEFSFKDLKKLPQFRYSKRLRPDDDADCVVCLEGIRQGQWCRKLSRCGHVFHRRCVDPWLVKVPACPICRTSVRPQMGALLEDRPLWVSGWRNELGVW